MALALFGADFGTPAMKMPIWAIALLLLRHHAEVELAGHLGLRGIVGLQSIAGILDDGAGLAAEDRRAFLVGIELDDAGRRVLLQGADKEVGRSLAGVRVEGDVPFVVEELAAEGQEDRIPAGDDGIAANAAEHDRIFDLAGRDTFLALGDELVPGGGRAAGIDVVAVGQGLQVADEGQRDELGRRVLEALDARALARRPVAHGDQRRRSSRDRRHRCRRRRDLRARRQRRIAAPRGRPADRCHTDRRGSGHRRTISRGSRHIRPRGTGHRSPLRTWPAE